jgi:hypothetical protein
VKCRDKDLDLLAEAYNKIIESGFSYKEAAADDELNKEYENIIHEIAIEEHGAYN